MIDTRRGLWSVCAVWRCVRVSGAVLCVHAAACWCGADPIQYNDRAAFVAATGAVAEPAWPNLGRLAGDAGATYHVGRVTIGVAAPSGGLWMGSGGHPLVGPDWTTLVEGNDLAIDGPENLTVVFDTPMTAFGFDFAEPTVATVQYAPCSQACPCANSMFRVTLSRLGVTVGTFDFSRPDDTAAFVGMWNAAPFDRAEVREMGGTCDDEYFGRFWTLAWVPPPPCPLDYNIDGVVNPDDLGDFITDYFTAPHPAGPGGYAIACPGNAPPYDAGYKTAYTPDGSGQCTPPFPDNLGDFITDYFGSAC